jgi:hypothetical protein
VDTTYTLILCANQRTADELNSLLPPPTRNRKIQAIFNGQIICGLHHHQQRPNVLIVPGNIGMEYSWYRNVLDPNMDKKYRIFYF